MERYQQCQSKKWNPLYHMESGSCQAEGWHQHYYCRLCKKNYNPFGWYKKPTEDSPCDCNQDEMRAMNALYRQMNEPEDQGDSEENITVNYLEIKQPEVTEEAGIP